MKDSNGLMEVFLVFQNTESYFNERDKKQSQKLIRSTRWFKNWYSRYLWLFFLNDPYHPTDIVNLGG